MKYTPNLNLKKPDVTDYVRIGDLNDNMDILDQEVQDIRGTIDQEVQDIRGTIDQEVQDIRGIIDQEVQGLQGIIDNTVQTLDAHTETRAALNKLGHVYHTTLTGTLNTDGWTGTEAPFAQSQVVSGILATDVPLVDVVLSGDWEIDEARLEAWGYIYRIVTSNGSITAYAREKPEVALPLQLKVVR